MTSFDRLPRRPRYRRPWSLRWLLFALLIPAAVIAAAPSARADDPSFLALSAGAFDVGKDHTAFEGRAEYRWGNKFWIFKPLAGGMFTSDAALYGYAGVLIDIYFGRRIVTGLSFAPGLYHKCNGKDLGHVLEFRSQIEIAYRFDDRSRLGVALSHMSNASIGDKNPGAESLVLTYSIPTNKLFGR